MELMELKDTIFKSEIVQASIVKFVDPFYFENYEILNTNLASLFQSQIVGKTRIHNFHIIH